MKRGMDGVQAGGGRSRRERELRGVIASELTEVLAELDELRPPREAPAEVARFVSAAERTLAVLHDRARADQGGGRPVAPPPPAPGSDDRHGRAETEDR